MTEKKIITPTVGRKVWFRPNGTTKLQVQNMPDVHLRPLGLLDAVSPLDATVVYVWDERMVNLSVQDHYGQSFLATSVTLLQEGDVAPRGGFYCEWMPYQVGQAKKEQTTQDPVPAAPMHADGSPADPEKFGVVKIDACVDLERQIKDAGADKAPRVTPADIEASIASVHYFVASDAIQHANAVHEHDAEGWLLGSTQLLTFCVIQLRNGFTVTGESACASPENFNAEIGRRIARENAINKIWPLLGFRLRDELASKA